MAHAQAEVGPEPRLWSCVIRACVANAPLANGQPTDQQIEHSTTAEGCEAACVLLDVTGEEFVTQHGLDLNHNNYDCKEEQIPALVQADDGRQWSEAMI